MVTDSTINNFDVFIIGGGVNGAGIARDAAGRGLNVGLADMGDLGNATSSASTKLFHGGLRYLEYFEFKLVKESLKEREVLLRSMPHISRPMKFVLPYHKDITFEPNTPASKLLSFLMPWNRGKRPAWLIQFGLFIYDNLGRRKILPRSKTINLESDPSGEPLKDKFTKGFEYSDCWVEDSRLVILNARDAKAAGAKIMPHHEVIEARKTNEGWSVTVKNKLSLKISNFTCKLLINAGGPWVEQILINLTKSDSFGYVRLIKGSHIVTKKLFDHEKSYFFQGSDGRIVFAIPYESDFTLIGTTDVPHLNIKEHPECSLEEIKYLLNFVNEYFQKPVTKKDIVWSYAGVRPLYEDGSKSASAVSRDYFLDFKFNNNIAPILHIYGGKLTTYRKLAEAALDKVSVVFPNMKKKWTSESYLPGGDFEINSFEKIIQNIQKSHTFLDEALIRRLVRLYGTDSYKMLENKLKKNDLGQCFGSGIYAFEVDWGIKNEWVTSSEDFLWRRTKLGLYLDKYASKLIEEYIQVKLSNR